MTVQVQNSGAGQVAFGAKLPTKAILEVVTGRCLREEGGAEGFYKVCNTMTGESNLTHELPDVCDKCSNALVKQFPVLGEVAKNAKEFFASSKKTLAEVNDWVAIQIKKIGSDELDVNPIKAD